MIDIFCQRISNSQKLQGGNTAPLQHAARSAAGCTMGACEGREKAGMGEQMA